MNKEEVVAPQLSDKYDTKKAALLAEKHIWKYDTDHYGMHAESSSW